MNSLIQTNRVSWAGRLISALPVLFLLFDSAIKFTTIEPVVDSFRQLGFSPSIAVTIGVLAIEAIGARVAPALR